MKKTIIGFVTLLTMLMLVGCPDDSDDDDAQAKQYKPVFVSVAPTVADVGTMYDYEVVVIDPDSKDENKITVTVNTDDTCGGTFTKLAIVNGNYRFTPDAGRVNTQCVVGLTASDGNRSVDQLTTVDIIDINTPPRFTSIAPTTVVEDVLYNYSITAVDDNVPPQNIVITQNLSDTCGGILLDNGDGTGTYSFTPDEAQGGTQCTVGLTVTDSLAASSDQNSVVDITEDNKAPVNNASANTAGDELELISFNINPSDPDIPTQALTCSITVNNCPDGALNGCVFEWTPTEAEGPDAGCDVTTRVSDGVLTDDVITTITVNEVNTAPTVVVGCPANVNEDAATACTITPTDADLPNGAPADPGAVTCSLNAMTTCTGINPAEASLLNCTSVTIPAQGEAVGPGACTVVLDVTDGYGATGQGNDTITIDESNTAPTVVVNCPANVDENTGATCTITPADNDLPNQLLTDPGSFTCSLNGATTCTGINPAEATLINCTAVTVPAQGEGVGPGSCTVVLDITDGYSATGQGNDTITIDEVNTAPTVVVDCPANVNEDAATACTITPTDADLPNGAPADPGAVTCSLNATTTCTGINPAEASLLNCTSVTVPAQGEDAGPGFCSIVVDVLDGYSASDIGVDTISIDEINQSPLNNAPLAISGDELTEIAFDMNPTDPDIPVQVLTCSFVSSTCPGVDAGNLTDCAFSWTPIEDDGPTVCDVVTRVDDTLTTTDATTTITVNEDEQVPVWTSVPTDISIGVNSLYNSNNGAASDSDLPNTIGGDPGYLTCSNTGDTCSFTVTVTGTGAGSANCNISFTSAATSESCTVNMTVTDGDGNSISQLITANVTSTWYVDPNAVGAGTCDSWADACTTIQAAMALAVSGDMVWVKGDETYTDTSGSGSAVLNMIDGVFIYGGFEGTEATLADRGNPNLFPSILDGEDTVSHVVIGASYALLDGFSIIGGYATSYGYLGFFDYFGGGILNNYVYDTTFSNLNIKYNKGVSGGGISNLYYSYASVQDSTIEYNYADQYGGGIYNSGSATTPYRSSYLALSNSNVSSNYAYFGGGMNNYYSYSVISNSVFNSNYAYGYDYIPPLKSFISGGGLLNLFSDVQISDSTFYYNTAFAGGGIQNIYSSPLITDSTISTNFSNLGAGIHNTYNSSPTVDDTLFIENIAASMGYPSAGAGMYNVYNSSPVISNSIFTLNLALGFYYPSYGGGMYNIYSSNPVISDTTFMANSALSINPSAPSYIYYSSGGGMMNIYSAPTVIGGSIKQNSAMYGAGMWNYYSYPYVTGTKINTNLAFYNGAGMWNKYSIAYINNSSIENNTTLGGGGAGLYSRFTGIYINNTTFSGNSASANGGAVWNHRCGMYIYDSVLEDNYSGNAGGAMFNRGTDFTINNCVFNRNEADETGGAMHVRSGNPVISNSSFNNNRALAGGGMFNDRTDPNISNVTFYANIAISPNSARIGGGAMYNTESSPTISNTVFSNNECYATSTGSPPFFGYGGGAGILNRDSSNPVISDSVFSNNTAFGGTAIFNAFYSSPNVSNTIFVDNYGFAGVGMLNAIYSSPTLSNVLFTGNIAYYTGYGPGPGAGMFNAYFSDPRIYNATFSDNHASHGGGIFNFYGSDPVISNSIMWGNTATIGSNEINNVDSLPVPFCYPVVTYSDINQNGYEGISGNIRNDPLFIGDYLLSHIATGQGVNSPAVDAGNPMSPLFGTTRTDGVADTNIIDMGYHHQIP